MNGTLYTLVYVDRHVQYKRTELFENHQWNMLSQCAQQCVAGYKCVHDVLYCLYHDGFSLYHRIDWSGVTPIPAGLADWMMAPTYEHFPQKI